MNYAQSVHFRSIDMTLERVGQVYQNLKPNLDQTKIIIVGGTNGKGSSVAMLESIFTQAGYSNSAFTSPHLIHFNERYRVNGQLLSDQQLIESFQKIESIRGDIPLTYFEFATLVAIDSFSQYHPNVMIMETGMGGRLDSVNILNPDCVLLTHVALDHTQWLGDTREQIGYEKAGLFRESKPAVCADLSPPQSVLNQAEQIGADLKIINREFSYSQGKQAWEWQGYDKTYLEFNHLPFPSIKGRGQLKNAAGVLMSIHCLAELLPVNETAIRKGLENIDIKGRLHNEIVNGHSIIFDVAHNVDAVTVLSDYLKSHMIEGRTLAVFGILEDKDIQQVISLIEFNIDKWELASLNEPRGTNADKLGQELLQVNRSVKYNRHSSPIDAFNAAVENATTDDRIVVFGSFHTVGDVLGYVNSKQS